MELKRRLGVVASAPFWRAQTALAVLILAIAGVAWLAPGQPVWLQAVVAAGLLLTVGVVARSGWLPLFGPVFFYDLVRIARRRRYLLLRFLYAVLLLLLLTSLYIWWSWNLPEGRRLSTQELTRFAETFFLVFMAAEFVVALVLTPAYTAGAVAEEKDRGTLQHLLSTDLSNSEIVLSKLLARLLNLTMIVLTGLPILGLTQFFGGVDPNLVLTGFAALALTLASLAGLSILHSTYARQSRDAIVLTYLSTAAYLGISYLLSEWAAANPTVAARGFSWDGGPLSGSLSIQGTIDAVAAGNLLVALNQLWEAWNRGQALTAILPGLLRRYAVFHLLAALLCAIWAVARVRSVAAKQTGQVAARTRSGRFRGRPTLGSEPLIWKEVHVERGLRLHSAAKVVLALLVLTSFAPAVRTIAEYADELLSRGARPGWSKELAMAMAPWVSVTGTLVACLALLGVAVRAAVSLSGERDKQTLDGLLTTPLARSDILYSKWLGSILGMRWMWVWMIAVWAIGIATGGMHYLALPLVLVAWIVFATFAANVGLYFSITSRTSLRAIVSTFVGLGAAWAGHWLIWGCCLPFFVYSSGNRSEFPNWIGNFQIYGLTPPMGLYVLSFQGQELQQPMYSSYTVMNPAWERFFCAVVGIVIWGVASIVLGRINSHRFRKEAFGEPAHASEFAGGAHPIQPGGGFSLDTAPAEDIPTGVPIAEPVEETQAVGKAVVIEETSEKKPNEE